MKVEIWHDTFGIDAFTDEEFEKLLEYGKYAKTKKKKERACYSSSPQNDFALYLFKYISNI